MGGLTLGLPCKSHGTNWMSLPPAWWGESLSFVSHSSAFFDRKRLFTPFPVRFFSIFPVNPFSRLFSIHPLHGIAELSRIDPVLHDFFRLISGNEMSPFYLGPFR